ncbi:MAG: 23S rRNA (uracil(1939)-C(5))-methyltransferase RlmD [Gemmatimonadota bacterium]
MRPPRSRRSSSRKDSVPLREAPRESQGVLRVDSIAAGGDGVGRIEGMVCFTPRTAPGDSAQVAYVSHAKHARGRVLQLLESSSSRVEPRCHHYVQDRCGGCQLQHIADDAQRTARLGIVNDALRRIGKRDATVTDLVTGSSWEYRTRLTLTLHRRGRGFVGGLHPYDDPSRVFSLTECPISHPALVTAWLAMVPLLPGLPVSDRLRVALRLAGALPEGEGETSRVSIVIEGGKEWPHASEWETSLRRAFPALHGVWWKREGTVLHTGSAAPSAAVAVRERGHVDDLAPEGSEAFEALAFAQVNRDVAEQLRGFVLGQVLTYEPAHVVDGYAGTGLLSEGLAAAGVRVTAIESDPSATAGATARLAAFTGARVITDRVESALPGVLPADVVVLNPPRRGVDPGVTGLLAGGAARGVRAIVYVSCDPATLSRDLTRLPAWRIAALRCFDMFPQTAHVETVCVLTPEVP